MEYKFKIQLKGITEPPVWREIVVPANFTFLRFHNVIQTAFGWEDCHLFEFKDKEFKAKLRIAFPTDLSFDFRVDPMDPSEVELSQIFKGNKRKLVYEYDFGDGWVHEINRVAVLDEQREEAYCVSGEGNCPPEDCGGSYAYEMMKKVLQTMPDSDRAEDFREWLGLEEDEVWDADYIDIDAINDDLKYV